MKKTALLQKYILEPEILVMPGAHDVLSARIIEKAGFKALAVGGYSATACLLGKPDLSFLTLTEMGDHIARLTGAVNLPALVDGDTGHGGVLNVGRTVKELERAGAAGIFIEDQVFPKRCGHMEGKQVLEPEEFVQKIKAAVDARRNGDFIIIARTDARSVRGFEEAVRRGNLYAEGGADLVFIESPQTTEEMASIPKLVKAPCLINMAGPASKTPALPNDELKRMGYRIAIHPGLAMEAAVTSIRLALRRLKDEGISWDPKNIVGPQKLFEAMGLATWRAREKKYISGEEDT